MNGLIAAWVLWERPRSKKNDIIYNERNLVIILNMFKSGDQSIMLKAAMDADKPSVQQCEALMWKFKQPLPWAKEEVKRVLIKQIFKL